MLYLKGERDTVFGLNKFMVYCSNGKKVVHVIFDPQGRAEEVTKMGAFSLLIDDQTVKFAKDRVIGPFAANGLINAMFVLDPKIDNDAQTLKKLVAAKSVGAAFQYAYEAPMFLGFQQMDFTEGREMLVGLLSSCK